MVFGYCVEINTVKREIKLNTLNVENFNKLCGEVNTGVKGISSSSCNIPRNRFAFHQADKTKVFVEKRQRNGKFLAYSLYDNMHFDADSTFIRECKQAKGYNSSELLAYLKNRGYKNIKILLRMNF